MSVFYYIHSLSLLGQYYEEKCEFIINDLQEEGDPINSVDKVEMSKQSTASAVCMHSNQQTGV